MKLIKSIFGNYFYLWKFLPRFRRYQFFVIIVLATLSSLAEIVSIGAVLPFVAALLNPTKLLSYKPISFFINFLHIHEENFLLFFTTLFILVYFFSNLIRLVTLYLTLRLSFAIGSDISTLIYSKTLDLSYSQRGEMESGEIISTIISKSDIVTFQAIVPIFTVISNVLMLILIVLSLLIFNPLIALTSILFFGFIYFLVAFFVNNKIINNGKSISILSDLVVNNIQQALRSHRETILNSLHNYYFVPFANAEYNLRKAQAFNSFIGYCPKFIIESIGVSFIAFLALYLSINNSNAEVISVIAVLAIASQKLLPILQYSYISWINMKGSSYVFDEVIKILKLKTYQDKKIINKVIFKKSIQFKNLGFSYGKSELFHNVNLNICKGDFIGIYGKSGSGKSTLIDLIMCFRDPIKGNLLVDKNVINANNSKGWQSNISLAPQETYLFNSTIKENITFMTEPFSKSQETHFNNIINLVDAWDLVQKFGNDNLGENGSKLSGGQKQKIGLARALYQSKSVLVIDEGTNAIDRETEENILGKLFMYSKLKKITVLFITHNINHRKFFTSILEINNRKVTQINLNILNTPSYEK